MFYVLINYNNMILINDPAIPLYTSNIVPPFHFYKKSSMYILLPSNDQYVPTY